MYTISLQTHAKPAVHTNYLCYPIGSLHFTSVMGRLTVCVVIVYATRGRQRLHTAALLYEYLMLLCGFD